jgi:glucan biosynthesis protein C
MQRPINESLSAINVADQDARPRARTVFLDNLRLAMVILVIMGHSALAYTGFAPWWYVDDSRGLNMPLMIFFALQEVFLMPAFLFSAGYFAPQSLSARGPKELIKSKARGLLVPWLVAIVLLCPMLQFVWNRHHGITSSYAQNMIGFFKAAAALRTGYVDGSGTDQFHQHHMWFISLLFCLFVLYAAVRPLRSWLSREGNGAAPRPEGRRGNLTKVLLVVIMVDAVAIFVSNRFVPTLFFFKIASIIQFQPVNLLTYMLYFGLGAFASGRGWFSRESFPGKPWAWGIGAVVSAMVYLTIAQLNMAPGATMAVKVAFAVARAVLCMAWFGLLLSTFSRYFHRQSRLVAQLSQNSFNLYIVHLNIVVLVQAALASWHGGPIVAKYVVVLATAIVLSHLVSRYLIQSVPKATTSALVVGSCVLVFFI